MAKNMLVGAKILKVNLRRSKLSRELFHVVSYRVILKMAGTKRICIGQVEPPRYDKFPVSIHDEAKMDIDLAKYLLLLSFYRQ